ncbi:Peptidase S24-like [Orenia metallireducens]|uniref:Peptidase S24-like n=1 Tax=Orenia metallireducens TaxID=1413210 RepID=A0A285GTN2_9FIRM|nr:S24 family peptidase [Orenia metallireducens]SNY26835.1 Peptidase S24-like [Orenia metallireducens]
MFKKIEFKELIEIALGDRSITQYANESDVNRTYISKIINEKLDSPPSPEILKKLAEHSQGRVTYKELMLIAGYLEGIESMEKLKDMIEIPIVESLSNLDKIKGYKLISKDKVKYDGHFFFKMKDDSMLNSGIKAGSLVLIRRQPEIDNEDIAAIIVDSNELLRKVYIVNDKLLLQPDNPNFKNELVSNEDVKIIGKSISVITDL